MPEQRLQRTREADWDTAIKTERYRLDAGPLVAVVTQYRIDRNEFWSAAMVDAA